MAEKKKTFAEQYKGLIDEEVMREYAWELKSGALKRFTSEELLRELKERTNRKIVQINSRSKRGAV